MLRYVAYVDSPLAGISHDADKDILATSKRWDMCLLSTRE